MRWAGLAPLLLGLFAAACVGERSAPILFDFAAEFARAESQPESRRIDFGDPASRSHLLDGWSVDERWEGRTSFVWGLGPASTVRFRLAQPRSVAITFRCLALAFAAAPPQVITPVLNGIELPPVVVESPAFTNYDLALPARALRSGDNLLELRYARWGAPAGELGAEMRPVAVAWDWLALRDAGSSPPARLGDSVFLPLHARLDYYLAVPSGSRLGVATVQPHPGDLADALLEVTVTSPERGERRHRLRPGRQAVSVPIDGAGSGPVRISFTVLGRAADPAGAGLQVWRPRVYGAATTVGTGAPAAAAISRAAGRRPNVLLYLVDTLRADHLGAYGYHRPVSPHVDALAREGLRFTRAYAASGWTRTSVASLLTGLSPVDHRVLGREDALPRALPTLAERLARAGWETVGFSSNDNVSPHFGFDRGFGRFVELAGPRANDGDAAEIHDAVLHWLGNRDAGRPFFAYVHTIDPHDPYSPPEPYRSRFAPRRRTALERVDPVEIRAALAADPELTPAAIRDDFEALYDGEIAYGDAHFGALLAELRRRGLYDETLIVFLSDHGEEFLDHGLWGHGHTLYHELLRVPLIVRFPGPSRPAVREAPVQLVDLAPSLLAWLGLAPGASADLLRGVADTRDQPFVALLRMDGIGVASVLHGDHHLVSRDLGDPRASLLLFDLRGDPAEARDVSATSPLLAGFLLGHLREQLARLEADSPAPTAAIDAELAGRLRALGYVR